MWILSTVAAIIALSQITSAQYGVPSAAAPSTSVPYNQNPSYGYDNYIRPPYRPILTSSHVCSLDVDYATYGNDGKKRWVPKIRQCAHAAFIQTYFPTTGNKGSTTTSNACIKCCKMSAQIQNSNISEDEVLGMMLIMHKRPLCACCIPNRPQSVQAASPQNSYSQASGYSAPAQSPPTYSSPPAQSAPNGY